MSSNVLNQDIQKTFNVNMFEQVIVQDIHSFIFGIIYVCIYAHHEKEGQLIWFNFNLITSRSFHIVFILWKFQNIFMLGNDGLFIPLRMVRSFPSLLILCTNYNFYTLWEKEIMNNYKSSLNERLKPTIVIVNFPYHYFWFSHHNQWCLPDLK